jgi:general secretion pathway protein I
MVALETELERTGFTDFDQSEDGTFEEEGHPEIRWTAEIVKPEVDLSPDRIVQLFTGKAGGLEELLGQIAPSGEGAPQQASPGVAAMTGLLQAQLATFGEKVKKGVREVRLTVSWPEGKRQESFTVVTHLVVLAPQEPGS